MWKSSNDNFIIVILIGIHNTNRSIKKKKNRENGTTIEIEENHIYEHVWTTLICKKMQIKVQKKRKENKRKGNDLGKRLPVYTLKKRELSTCVVLITSSGLYLLRTPSPLNSSKTSFNFLDESNNLEWEITKTVYYLSFLKKKKTCKRWVRN